MHSLSRAGAEYRLSALSDSPPMEIVQWRESASCGNGCAHLRFQVLASDPEIIAKILRHAG